MESVDSPCVQTRSGAPDDLVSHTNDLQRRHRLRAAGGNAGKLPAHGRAWCSPTLETADATKGGTTERGTLE